MQMVPALVEKQMLPSAHFFQMLYNDRHALVRFVQIAKFLVVSRSDRGDIVGKAFKGFGKVLDCVGEVPCF